ncbi:MAG: transcriptional regulator NrdR [Streptococcaceae bacterium]|jgi:transcriptional repressor NrdR|nr:transcriptional regulator NrdR [Streptococcaceae bacterium]
MKCLKCGSEDSKVLDTRAVDEAIRRRRECESCGYRFTTFERVEAVSMLVIKKDGTREEYDREKMLRGIIRSAQKRPISVEAIEASIDKIEAKIRTLDVKEVPSETIGEFVMEELAKLDEITYIRFASVYRSFKDVSELETLLKSITKGK